MMRNTCATLALLLLALCTGCVGAKPYNSTPQQYLRQIPIDNQGRTYDIAIIEFDDHGEFWNPAQLRDAVRLIRQRNAESKSGILTSVYIHGWTHNADPTRSDGALQKLSQQTRHTAREFLAQGPPNPDHVVLVYLGWRGDRISIPGLQQLTFWDRLGAARRVASLDMQETFSAIISSTKERSDSKLFIYGHSLGGAILEQMVAPILAQIVQGETHDRPVPFDLIVLVNPAIDALHARKLIAVLRRHNAALELATPDGARLPARGPLMVSITSEADVATKYLYPAGMMLGTLFASYRKDESPGEPSQASLARTAEGHADYVMSHRAYSSNGEIKVEAIPNAFNDTPFWVISTSREICGSHSDISNPRLRELVVALINLNRVHDTQAETRMTWQPWSETSRPAATQGSPTLRQRIIPRSLQH